MSRRPATEDDLRASGHWTEIPQPRFGHTKAGYYCLLPRDLLDRVATILSPTQDEAELLAQDRELADGISDSSIVAFWQDVPIRHDVLNDQPAIDGAQTEQAVAALEANTSGAKASPTSLEEAERKRRQVEVQRRAFCGWLILNPRFIATHDKLVRRWSELIEEHGLPQSTRYLQGDAEQVGAREPPEPERSFLRRFIAFYRGWQIVSLVAPYLPLPPAPQWPQAGAHGQPAHLEASTPTLATPSVQPTPTGEELRDMAETAANAERRRHTQLGPWHELIAKEETNKQALNRYARLFRFQHYWRLLFRRYPHGCYRKKDKLREAFAEWLGVDEETPRKDHQVLVRHLGRGWEDSP